MTALDERTEPAGLRLLRSWVAEGKAVGVADLVGLRIDRLDAGHAVLVCHARESFANPMGTVSGGIVATLLDSALGCAVQTTLDVGVGYTTVSLEVKYLRPIPLDTGELRAAAAVVHLGRRQATAEARLSDEHGRLLATATTTCFILSAD